MNNVDYITIILAVVFLLPILIGAFGRYRENRFFNLFSTLVYTGEILLSLFLSIYLTKMIFFENSSGVFKSVYDFLPSFIKDAVVGNNNIVFVVILPIVFVISMLLLSLMMWPLINWGIGPLSDFLDSKIRKSKPVTKHLVSGLFGIPAGVFFVIITVLAISVHSYFFYNPDFKNTVAKSGVYQLIYKNTVRPIFESNLIKKIPVLLNDSFKSEKTKTKQQSRVRVIKYFNGVTLEEGVKSSAAINAQARSITAGNHTDSIKAYNIYRWVSQNVSYDYDKARNILKTKNDVQSGAIVAFNTKKGICFDYASLYVAMCRAVNLKVRLITGLGYSGLSWGDHAWNEVYAADRKKWINVDCTFGKSSNYFDNPNFGIDHRDREVQGQWQ